MDLPPSAVPRRRAPPQGRLCGRSPASSERRRVASLVAVPAGAPVSVARPRPPPKETTAPGKPAPCGSRASPDPGRRPSTRRTVRPRRGPGAGGTRRQPSPARPAVAGYGISPRSRCGLPEPRHCIGKRGRPVHNPEPDMAGFAPQRSVVHLGATTWVQTSAGTCHTEPSPPDTSGLVPPCSGISVLPAPDGLFIHPRAADCTMTSPPAYATTGRDSTAACAPCGKGDVLVGWNPEQAAHRRPVSHLRQIRRQLFDRRREHAAAIRHGTRSNLHPAPRARHPPRRILQPHRIRPHGRCRHTRAGSPGHTAAGHRTSAAAARRDRQRPAPSGPQTMTDDKTDVPCPIRTLAVRSRFTADGLFAG